MPGFVFYFILILSLHLSGLHFAESITTRLVTDKNELAKINSFMAELIVSEFALYPYLADCLASEEEEQMKRLLESNDRAVGMLYSAEKPIGFVAGIPLICYFPQSILFSSYGYAPENIYYISDIILLPAYQGKGLVRRLFPLIEEYARSKRYAIICLACESHEFHSLKPLNYRELGNRWYAAGYTPTPYSEICYWKTLSEQGFSFVKEHRLDYWVKKLF